MLQRRVFFVLGLSFLLFSIIFLNFGIITGLAVQEGQIISNPKTIALWFFISGTFLLFLTREQEWTRYRVNLISQEYERGTISPIDAALKINSLYSGDGRITGVEYHGENPNMTLRTSRANLPIRLSNEKKARDLALAVYEVAIHNSPANLANCEMHLSRTASTKHHKTGFQKEVENFERSNRRELSKLRN